MNGPGNHAEHIWPGLGSCGERKCVSSEPGVPRQDAWGRGAPATSPPHPPTPPLTILRKQKQGLLLES